MHISAHICNFQRARGAMASLLILATAGCGIDDNNQLPNIPDSRPIRNGAVTAHKAVIAPRPELSPSAISVEFGGPLGCVKQRVDMVHQDGMYTSTNGIQYRGEWSHNRPHGWGTLTTLSGSYPTLVSVMDLTVQPPILFGVEPGGKAIVQGTWRDGYLEYGKYWAAVGTTETHCRDAHGHTPTKGAAPRPQAVHGDNSEKSSQRRNYELDAFTMIVGIAVDVEIVQGQEFKVLFIPSFYYQMAPKIPLNTRCSISISKNLSINGRTRSSDQLGIWSYNINP